MSSNLENNKRIAKNACILYIRMLLSMGVSLYTSRIILQTLGIVDYGIYNVVNSLVVISNFLVWSLSSSTQRYIQYEIVAKNKEKLRLFFLSSMNLFFILSIIVVILGETLGLWFLNNKMDIPADRYSAAMWVYQLSIITTVYTISATPFNALIISYERMSVFAYITIIEVFLKLLVALGVSIMTSDHLVIYALFSCILQIIIRSIYRGYCVRTFTETRYAFVWNRKILKEMLSFSSWTLIETLSSNLSSQGVKVLLNVFFGPVMNTAIAIGEQVKMAVTSLRHNFQTAINPQITKSYAANNIAYTHSLILQSMKYSYFMLWILALPICLQIDYILFLWLGKVPTQTSVFVILLLISSIIESLTNPLGIAAEAMGRIKKIKLITSGVSILTVPISYFLLSSRLLHISCFTPIIIYIILISWGLIIYIIYLHRNIGLSYMSLFEMCSRIIVVSLVSFVVSYCLKNCFCTTIIGLLIISFASITSSIIIIYLLGMDKLERNMIKTYLVNYVTSKRIFKKDKVV